MNTYLVSNTFQSESQSGVKSSLTVIADHRSVLINVTPLIEVDPYSWLKQYVPRVDTTLIS